MTSDANRADEHAAPAEATPPPTGPPPGPPAGPVLPPPGAVPLPGVPFPGQAPIPLAPGRRVQLRRRARVLVIAGLAVLVLALAVVAISLVRGDPDLTYRGEEIVRPERTLADAEQNLRAIVEDRRGATNDHTRCYFSLREGESSDVRDLLRCGPVLFIDGDADEPYLTFALEARRGEDDGVRLTAAEQPHRSTPERLRSSEELRRPDGESPPDGSGGLEPPPPPRAEPGLLEAGGLDGVDWEDPEGDAVLGAFNASYEIQQLAQPARVGRGDEARRPARGERFLAVRLIVDIGEAPSLATEPVEAVVQVDEAEPLPLPPELRTPWAATDLLISVPEDTERVDLVVTDVGVEQRLSLVDGEPGPDNVEVLRRDNVSQTLSTSGELAFTVSAPGYVPASSSVDVTVTSATLFWFNQDGSDHAAGPDRAWLVMGADFAWAPELDLGPEYGLNPELWKLTGGGGNLIPAIDVAPEPESFIVAFDVPANFTQGTVVIGGRYTAPDGLTVDFGTSRLEVPVEIPAG